MQTIYRQDAGRITVADAKHLIRQASPNERVVDVYVEVRPDDVADADAPLNIKHASAERYDLSIKSDFDALSIKPRNRWRPALMDYETGTGQDALYTIDHAEFVRLAERHGGNVVVQQSSQATPTTTTFTTGEHAELEKLVDWYNAALGADVWRKLPAVKPEDAALLLCEYSPASTKADEIKAQKITNPQVSWKDFLLLFSALEALSASSHSLADWRFVAKKLGLTYHDWIDKYEEAMALLDPSNVPTRTAPTTPGDPANAEPAVAASIAIEAEEVLMEPEIKTAAPSRAHQRNPSWWEVTSDYMAGKLKDGRFVTAKALYVALYEEAGTAASPFDKGIGARRGDLHVRQLRQSLSLKTVQNKWSELRAASSTK